MFVENPKTKNYLYYFCCKIYSWIFKENAQVIFQQKVHKNLTFFHTLISCILFVVIIHSIDYYQALHYLLSTQAFYSLKTLEVFKNSI